MRQIRLKHNNQIIHDLGIALVITGVPLGMYFKYLFPIIAWSPVFMALSIVAIIDYKRLFDLNFSSFNNFFKA